MKAYATMNEMEDYIRKGKDNFIRLLGDKTIAYKKFVDKLDKVNKKFDEFPHEKLGTKKGKQIVDNLCTYWAVEILILSTLFQNRPISKNSIEFMYNNYDRERALSYFDKAGYEVYMKQKESQKAEEIKDEQAKSKSEEKQVYDSDNYIDLE